MKINGYTIHTVETGYFGLDGGAMFGTVPKVLWEKKIPSDDQNRIPMALRTLLIEGNGKKILIDTGMGHKWSDKQERMYNLDYTKTTLDLSLEKLGLNRDDISDVILTHLHFDHAGGATQWDGNEQVPAFKNATYYVQRKNYEWAIHPNDRERASYLMENFMPLANHNRLEFVHGNEELFPGIHTFTSNGHTIGMQLVRIGHHDHSVVYCADLIPTSAHIPTPWIMGYDIQPMVILEEKDQFLKKAYDNGWILFFEHDPVIEGCMIKSGKKYFEAGDSVHFS